MSDLIPLFAPWSGRIATAAVALLGLALVAFALWRRRHSGPLCPRCRYDLSATPLDHPCPECGARSTAAGRARSPRRWRLAVIGLLIAASLPAYVAQRRMRRFGWDYYLRLEPLYSIWPNRFVERRRIGPLTVTTLQDRRWFGRTLAFRCGGAEIGRYANPLSYRFHEPGDPELGLPDDINGDGARDAVLDLHSGGAHCCQTLVVISIGDSHAWMSTVVSGSDANSKFLDLDDDGIFEVETGDDTFLYWKNSYAASPQPPIVLAWNGAEWMLSPSHMAAPAPSPDELKALAAAHQALREYEDSVWTSGLPYTVIDLIYTGNADSAIHLAHLAWQPRWEGDPDGFLADIADQLATSPYLAGLQNLNPTVDLGTLAPR
jgi:hypothetical protein